MVKNIVIILLVVVAAIEGFFVYRYRREEKTAKMQLATSQKLPPAGPNARGAQRPIILSRGMNLTTTPLYKYTYKIAPGEIADSAKQALTGWTVTTNAKADGSTVVTLTPKDSDDQNQQYTIKSGQVLYFVEQTPADDKVDADKDLNYRDDYGIITDQNGIIQ